ncbi:MAG: RluA family pseudouridine synthase [Mariprofundaceae bacterium]|nr:RluA family pseudouridine synthase [Mariprofundaceae bacterium]
MGSFQDHSLTVPAQPEDTPLDRFLIGNLPLSKQRIRRAIHEGGVYINRKRCRHIGQMMHGGETVRIVMLDDEKLIPFSEAQLLWNSPPFYLIHKQSGQYAQEALHRSQGTLPDELTHYLKLSDKAAAGLRPVHRLDRDTSGLMLFCSEPGKLDQMQKLWHSHVSKSYLAVVDPAPEWDVRRITQPIGNRRDSRGCYHIDGAGRVCETEAEVIERHSGRALIRLIPHTGRTHQLRIHLSYLGCPILGDRRYGGKNHARMMLHAHRLHVRPPALPQEMKWTAEPEENWQW